MSKYLSVDSIIMKDVTASLSGEMHIKTLFTTLFGKVPRIFVFIIVKHALASTNEAFAPIKEVFNNLFCNVFYSKKCYKTGDITNEDYHICTVIRNEKALLGLKSPAIYFEEANEVLTLHHMPLFHKKELARLEELGNKIFEKYMNKVNGKIIYNSLRLKQSKLVYKTCTFSKLYPSANYVRLGKMIKRHFDIASITGNNSVLGVLLDGPPGLGKTKFTDFAVEHAIAGAVYKTDLTSFLNFHIEEVLPVLYDEVEITQKTIFVIDELDKYLDRRLRRAYNRTNVCLRSIENLTGNAVQEKPSFEEFCREEKQEYLYKILRVLERDVAAPVVVIFCSNNFSSIFEGVDMRHHKSLYSRFLKVGFEKCDREELTNYIAYYNNKFAGTEYHQQISEKEIRNRLKEDVSVTYRQLYHISIEANYEAEETIRLLNAFEGEEELPAEVVDTEEEEVVTEDDEKEKEKPATMTEAWQMEYSVTGQEYKKNKGGAWVSEQKEAIKTVASYLGKVEDARGKENKKVACIALFDYLTESVSMWAVLDGYPKLFAIIKDKIVQLSKEEPDLFLICKPATAKFLCAVSGLQPAEL